MKLLNTLAFLPLLAAAVPVYKPASIDTPFALSSLENGENNCSPHCAREWQELQECNWRVSCSQGPWMRAIRKAYVRLSHSFSTFVHVC